MKTKFQFLTLIAAVAVSAVAIGAVQGLSVKRAPKEGQTIKYRMEGEIQVSGISLTMRGIMQEKVTKVETNGDYIIEQEQLETKVIFDGNEQEVPMGGPTTTTYRANGEIVKIEGSEDPENSLRMANLGLLVDPGKELNVGDKWTHEVKADSAKGAIAAKADYQVLAEERVAGVDTIKIKADVKEAEGGEPAESTSTIWLAKSDRSMVQLESTWKNAPFPNAPGNLNAKVKMTRIN